MPDRTRRTPRLPILVLAVGFAHLPAAAPPALYAADSAPAAAAAAAPTADEARQFVEAAEKELLQLWTDQQRAQWVQSTYITGDTETIAAQYNEKVIARAVALAQQATRFDGLKLPEDVARKLGILKLTLVMPAPADAAKTAELARIGAEMEGLYGQSRYCRGTGAKAPGTATGSTQGAEAPDVAKPGEAPAACLDEGDMTKILAESRDPKELLDVWQGWHANGARLRKDYERNVELGNEGARELGYKDLGAMWRSKYDMPPDAFAAELDRLWNQVRPLYEKLHCYTRARLVEKYGPEVVPPQGPIPAHLLGNMWAQTWDNVYDVVAPKSSSADGAGVDITKLLEAKKTDVTGMFKYGEGFFTSLGFPPLPETFWTRSMLVQPRDRDVVCHASAWDIDSVDDLRIKMCTERTGEDFKTLHHELGHNFYQRAYSGQPPLFRDSANDGFHEAIGDTVALSVTPGYLVKIGLLDKEPASSDDIPYLLRMALDKIAFLPFGLVLDQWRWKVFSGEIGPEHYNEGWWQLREKYQGVAPPVARTEADFDAGAKYHIPANVPYMRYFLADILQFQFHRGLCKTAGYEGPLHRCSIYGSKAAGEQLASMLAMGSSRPWPEALEKVTGQKQMDATAILDYFAPLSKWLDEQNKGQKCGW